MMGWGCQLSDGVNRWTFNVKWDKHPPVYPPKKKVEFGGFPSKKYGEFWGFPFFVNKKFILLTLILWGVSFERPEFDARPVLESWRVLPFLSKHMWTKMLPHILPHMASDPKDCQFGITKIDHDVVLVDLFVGRELEPLSWDTVWFGRNPKQPPFGWF